MRKRTAIIIIASACMLGLTACGNTTTAATGIDKDNYINTDYGVYGAGYGAASRVSTAEVSSVKIPEKEKDELLSALSTCRVCKGNELPDGDIRSLIDLYESDGDKVCSILKYELSDKIYLQDEDGISILSGEDIREQTDKILNSI